jgi:hypothetical protein
MQPSQLGDNKVYACDKTEHFYEPNRSTQFLLQSPKFRQSAAEQPLDRRGCVMESAVMWL